MIGSEGLLVMIEAIVAKPMTLALYTKLVAEADPRGTAFKLAKDTPVRSVVRADWAIEPGEKIARMGEHVFRFAGPSTAEYFGWVLLSRDERACMAWQAFAKPYPINTERDTIKVAPALRANRF